MNETILRVIQALETGDSFTYVLTEQQMLELDIMGYHVEPLDVLDFGLFDCEITRHESRCS